jgi:putative SOS response-associated peptidase YedK
MCGRFARYSSPKEIAAAFGVEAPDGLAPRYNVSPTQTVLAVRPAPGPAGRELVLLRWGLVPSWSKGPSAGPMLINARADTVATKPSFRSAFRRHRCLIPADAFFEWKAAGKQKQPYLFALRDRRPFAFAGLWERWLGPDGDPLESCAIVTTEANERVFPVHDRMPVILPPESYAAWLDPEIQDRERLLPLLRPYPAEEMTATPVSQKVNSPRNDYPGCIEPAAKC